MGVPPAIATKSSEGGGAENGIFGGIASRAEGQTGLAGSSLAATVPSLGRAIVSADQPGGGGRTPLTNPPFPTLTKSSGSGMLFGVTTARAGNREP